MKRQLLLFLVLFFICECCVSTKKYNTLQDEYNKLQKDHDALKKEDADTKQTSDSKQSSSPKKKADSKQSSALKQTDVSNKSTASKQFPGTKQSTVLKQKIPSEQTQEYYYTKGINFYNKKEYNKAFNSFQTLIDKFPDDKLVPPSRKKIKEINDLLSNNYNKILKLLKLKNDVRSKIEIINTGLSEKYLSEKHKQTLYRKRQNYYGDLRIKEEIDKNIEIRDDPIQSCRFYETRRITFQDFYTNYNSYSIYQKRFNVQLYIVEPYSRQKQKYFRIRTMYNAYEWMLYKRVIIRGDNGAQLNIDCVEPEKKKDKSGKGVKEWSDNYIDKEKEKIVIKLGEANKITVRFDGKYRYDYIMNEDQLLAFKEIAIIWGLTP